MGERFLSFTEVAAWLGIRPSSLQSYRLPEPDAWVGKARGWRLETVEAWNAARPGKPGRPRKAK